MRFAFLGSGSRGNGLVVQKGATCLLVDCGFTLREVSRRLSRLGLTPEQLTAIFVTHEHADHIRGVGPLARRHRVPVWMTHGTGRAGQTGPLPEVRFLNAESPCEIHDVRVLPYRTPHDAREPVQFVFDDGAHRLGLLTDSGHVTPHMERMLTGLDALVLECNHDPDMLRQGPYPRTLKARVGGPFGHLSNAQAADLAARLDVSRWQHLVAAHLSETNNSAELAAGALSQALSCTTDWIQIARQDDGLAWRALS